MAEEPAVIIAREFHAAYEDHAPLFGYRTREESAKPWDEIPRENRLLMIAVVHTLLMGRIIAPGPHLDLFTHEPIPVADEPATGEQNG